jgi:hypothetical protein
MTTNPDGLEVPDPILVQIASGPDEHCPTSKDDAMIHCNCWYE